MWFFASRIALEQRLELFVPIGVDIHPVPGGEERRTVGPEQTGEVRERGELAQVLFRLVTDALFEPFSSPVLGRPGPR